MGNYFRFFDNEKNNIVGYCVTDDFLTLRELKNKVDKNISGSQCINYRKNENYNYQFDNLGEKYNPTTKNKIDITKFIHQLYNFDNKVIKEKNVIFELTDDFLKVDNKKYKLVEKGYKYKYFYKILKTQINVRNIKEFKTFIINSMKNDNPFNTSVNIILNKLQG